MTKNLVNHPGMWLADDAADSLARWEAAKGRLPLSDAGRTVAEQQALINRWNAGGAANRPPYLYQPYMPAASGPHVGGHAVDIAPSARGRAEGPEFGWMHDVASDDVHFVYHPERDSHRGGGAAASGGNSTVANEQNWLNVARGEKLTTDGVAGPATKEAIKRYQTFLRGYGYAGAIDGIWGNGTQEAHGRYYTAYHAPAAPTQNGRPVVAKGSTGQAVKDLQWTLNTRYPAYSKLAVDGVFGAGTEATLREFQRRAGLVVDGIAGPAVYKYLNI